MTDIKRLAEEAHEAVNIAWTKFSHARNGQQRHQAQVALKHVGAAIDALAAAVEVAEGMHALRCGCHPLHGPGACTFLNFGYECCVPIEQHPVVDTGCEAARDRLRAELAALQEGKDAE